MSRRIVTVGDDFTLPARILQTLPVSTGGGTTYLIPTPASTWNISHSLQRLPSVTLYDTSGAEVEADVVSTATTVVVTFPAPFAGSAVLT